MTFTLNDLPDTVLIVVVAAVVVGIGATITADLSTSLGGNANATARQAMDNGTEAMSKIGSKLPLIGTIVALAIVLGVVFSALVFRN
jgi:hypothetical protein